jgi:tetratricopeptide (TPR) repeat protein
MQTLRVLATIGFVLTLTRISAADDPVPDEAATRKQVDVLIQQAPNHQATLGTLQGAMNLSVSFGAPAWNAGDHDACCRFYVKTGESLLIAFDKPQAASPAARALLDDLKSAVDRSHNSNDVDLDAWTMRYVFDKTAITVSTEAGQSAQLIALGQQSFARSQFADAANAFAAATAALHELDGQPVDQIPAECRIAPLALSDALFGQKKYTQAAAAVQDGFHFIPQWASVGGDIRKHFADPAVYELLFDDLRDNATAHQDDPSLQFLFGYQLFFSGRKVAAKEYFQKTLKLDPKNDAAKILLDACDPNHKDAPPIKVTPGGSQA